MSAALDHFGSGKTWPTPKGIALDGNGKVLNPRRPVLVDGCLHFVLVRDLRAPRWATSAAPDYRDSGCVVNERGHPVIRKTTDGAWLCIDFAGNEYVHGKLRIRDRATGSDYVIHAFTGAIWREQKGGHLEVVKKPQDTVQRDWTKGAL